MDARAEFLDAVGVPLAPGQRVVYATAGMHATGPLVPGTIVNLSATPRTAKKSGSALLHHTLERADLLLEIAELTSELGQAAWLDLGLGELGVHRGSFGQQ